MTDAFTSQPIGGQPTGFASLLFQSAQPFQLSQPLPSSQANNISIQSQSTPQHRPFSSFIPQQVTGLPSGSTVGLLPQPTGANPFRQSVLIPQATASPAFNINGIAPMPPPSAQQIDFLSQRTSNLQLQSPGQPVTHQSRQPAPSSTHIGHNIPSSEVPVRPASTPLTSIAASSSSSSPPMAQPVKPQQTGSRNPFGVPVTPAPPVPRPPTLWELSMGFGRPGIEGSQPPAQSQSTAAGHQVPSINTATTESTFSTVASSFAFTNKPETSASSPTSDVNRLGSFNSQVVHTATSPNASDSVFYSLPSQPSNPAVPSHALSVLVTGPIKSQPTGFGGVRPFKPTSSFGASLLESLPPIPQSSPTTPDSSIQATNHAPISPLPTNLTLNGFSASSASKDSNVSGTIHSLPTGLPQPSQRTNGRFTPGVGLRPQATGAVGAANPFRATMFATTPTSSTVDGVSYTFVSSASTPLFGGLGNEVGSVQQQNAGASLI